MLGPNGPATLYGVIEVFGRDQVVAPGLVNVKSRNNSEFAPGDVPPRRPCHNGLLPYEESMAGDEVLLVKAPPRFPENVQRFPAGAASTTSNVILKRRVVLPKFAIVKPFVTNDLELEFEARSQPTTHEVTG